MRVNFRIGAPYHCPQRDLDLLRLHPDRNNGPFVSQRQATLEIVGHNDLRRWLPLYEQQALNRVSHAIHDIARYLYGPDLALKRFLDLGIAFFGGALQGHVGVSRQGRACFTSGDRCLGQTMECSHPAHVLIHLNAEAILLGPSPFERMSRTVLHEMCVSTIRRKIKQDDRFFLSLC